MERHCCRNQELNEFGGQDGGSGCLDVLAEAGKLGFDWVWLLWMRVLLAAVCFVGALGCCGIKHISACCCRLIVHRVGCSGKLSIECRSLVHGHFGLVSATPSANECEYPCPWRETGLGRRRGKTRHFGRIRNPNAGGTCLRAIATYLMLFAQ